MSKELICIFSFPFLIAGKVEIVIKFCVTVSSYFDNLEIFFEFSSTKHTEFVQIIELQ